MNRIKKYFTLFIINNFLSCTRFFNIKRRLLLWSGIEVGENSKIVGPLKFGNQIKITIGKNCWIGKGLNLDGNGEVIIGDNVDIAPHVTFNTGGHYIGTKERRAGEGIVTKIEVGNGTWIGTRALIINNTKINDGCVIAAGSVVNKGINKDTLVAGVPAKLIKNLNIV